MTHRDACRARFRRWYWAHPDERREASRRWSQANPERVRAKVLRYRARLKSQAEPYRDSEIFLRDAWQCALCTKPVDPLVARSDRMGATIDHITPLSAGGRDAAANVQLAHRTCNSSKRDRLE